MGPVTLTGGSAPASLNGNDLDLSRPSWGVRTLLDKIMGVPSRWFDTPHYTHYTRLELMLCSHLALWSSRDVSVDAM